MREPLRPGSLKLVTGWSATRSLRDTIEQTLTARIRADVLRLGDALFLIYTEAETSELRDWLSSELEEDESVFVVEFERWSSSGPAVDRGWLLRRGH